MNNYLLSIDPSIKNTGFTLWEKECELNCKYLWKTIETNTQHTNDIWKPIWINSYNFKKYDEFEFQEKIIREIVLKMSEPHGYYKSDETKQHYWLEDLEIIIERGFPNMMGSEKLDHLRGFIAGQFSHMLKKEMLVNNLTWKKWYVNKYVKPYWKINYIGLEEELKYQNEKTKWNKLLSLLTAKYLIEENNWNITISNHDEADSLLIGWYYLNKENK